VKVVINGLNSNSAGGLSVVSNFTKTISSFTNHEFTLLVSAQGPLSKLDLKDIKIIALPNFLSRSYMSPIVYEFYLPQYLKSLSPDIVVNFGDLIINSNFKQLMMFDWSYAIYDEPDIWDKMFLKDRSVRLFKKFLFRKRVKKVDKFMTQTSVAKNRLESTYNLKNVEVVPNAVSLDNLERSQHKFEFDTNKPNGFKFLYLSRYYPHKNIEVLLDVAQMIKEKKHEVSIVITIDSSQSVRARSLLREIELRKLSDILINIGNVDMSDVPSLYRACDALIMPTLLESFSGTYVEAMFHERPIFTSNLDFARIVCGDAACYFDPRDPNDIFEKIVSTHKNKNKLKILTDNGLKKLAEMNTWHDSTKKIIEIINNS
jgi:glycosyltransferase involved in cell wall biosynthesis